MEDIRSLITYLIINWNQDTYILFRIRFMIGLLLALYIIMCACGVAPFSPKSDKSSTLNLLDALSDSILVYILGAMQATSSKNQAFPVLALALVSYRSTLNSLSKYGTYTELRNMLKLLAVAYMNVTHGLWGAPFWIFWSSLVLKSLNRILARHRVSESLWHGQSSELLQEYMDAVTPDRCNPETMEGYTYLVYGEAKRNNKKSGHSLYNLRSLITLDKIWRHGHPLLRCINKQGNNMKDLCLAVALSRLLRCRLEGATLHAGSVSTTRKLIYSQILTNAAEGVPADNAEKVLVKNAEKAFGTLVMELSFFNDYLHTSFPMVFCEGSLLSLTFTLLQSVIRYSMALWLIIDVDHRLGRKNTVHEPYLDYSFTAMAIASVMSVDIFEVIMYILSDWTTLLCICKYVNGSTIFRHFIISWGRNIFNRHRNPCLRTRTGQYIFVHSFSYNPWNWKLLHTLSMGVVASKGDGMKLSDAIKLPEMVKARVFEALCSLRSRSFEGHHLPAADLMPLCATEQQVNHQHYWHECLQLPTCSQAILVWHIATSLCEMKLAQDRGMDLSNKQELLVDEKSLDGDLRTNYGVANSLSRYCAYLLVARPDLLPDTILVPKVILQKAVSQARGMLRGCDSVHSMYIKLLAVGQDEPSIQDRQYRKLSINIVQCGAVLGRKLIEDEHHWKQLAKVWVNLLVHIAPSSKAEAHAKYLEFGGEFVTLIWALFCHCGIERSQLWQENASTSRNSSPGSSCHQSNGFLAPTTEVQQTAVTSAPPAAQTDAHASDLESGGRP